MTVCRWHRSKVQTAIQFLRVQRLRARVPLKKLFEDVPFIEKHERAGASFGVGNTVFDDIALKDFVEQRRTNIHYPFRNQDDWEVAAWLSKSGLSMAYMDDFLRLAFVSFAVVCSPLARLNLYLFRSNGKSCFPFPPRSNCTIFWQSCPRRPNGRPE